MHLFLSCNTCRAWLCSWSVSCQTEYRYVSKLSFFMAMKLYSVFPSFPELIGHVLVLWARICLSVCTWYICNPEECIPTSGITGRWRQFCWQWLGREQNVCSKGTAGFVFCLPALTSCQTLGQNTRPLMPQFPLMQKGNNNSVYLVGSWSGSHILTQDTP